jgi:cell division protein FtsB
MDHKLTRKHPPSAKAARRFGPTAGRIGLERSVSSHHEAHGRSVANSALRSRKNRTPLAPEAAGGVSTEPPISFIQQMREFLHGNATWFLVAGFILLALQDIFGAHGLVAMRRSEKEAAAVQKEIQQLNEENQQLQNRVQSLKTDPATIERIAREEMGLARPGEYIFKLQPKPGEPSTPLAEPAEPPSSQPPHPKRR